MIADNKIYTLGIDNLDTLNEFLESMMGDLDIPGYDEDILKQMVADAEEVTEKISSYGTLDDDEIQTIKEKAAEPIKPIHPGFGSNEPQNAGNQTSLEPSVSLGNGQDGPLAHASEEEPTTVRKSVVCPKCGEVIWL